MLARTIKIVLLGALLFIVPAGLALLLLPSLEGEDIRLTRTEFTDLVGWPDDNHAEALGVFRKSCVVLMRQKPSAPVSPKRVGGRVVDWQAVCEAAASATDANARVYFEDNFSPVAVADGDKEIGLFTGYYEPIIPGSLVPDPEYPVPAYRRPPELVMVDLGLFRGDLGGRRIAGSVAGGRLQPFQSRDEIEAGALANRDLELIWLKDPVDLFFVQVQGSGRVRLPDGSLVGIGYDGLNGHPYTAIGRVLVARGEVKKEDMSMQAIREWIAAHPEDGLALMQANASYVFFRFREKGGAVGTHQTVLTPERSLAVDRAVLPLGAPVWLETSHPDPDAPQEKELPLNRLMVTEDTGGAIRGAVRGDVFWGLGERAGVIAGSMASDGRYFLLLPNRLAAHVLKEEPADGPATHAP